MFLHRCQSFFFKEYLNIQRVECFLFLLCWQHYCHSDLSPRLITSQTYVSLTYTAPKQPLSKTARSMIPALDSKSVILFKEVTVNKVLSNTVEYLGPSGIVLIGSELAKLYQVLLYKEKDFVLTTTKIQKNFVFVLEETRSTSFTDDDNQRWLVEFKSESDLNEFAQEIHAKGGVIVDNRAATNIQNVQTPTPKPSAIELDESSTGNQSDSCASIEKETILPRVAKVGQRMVSLSPAGSQSTCRGSDSGSDRYTLKPYRRMKRSSSASFPPQDDVMETSPHPTSKQSIGTQYTPLHKQYFPAGPSQMTQAGVSASNPPEMISSVTSTFPAPISYDQVSMYFTENRTHNSEVRINVSRLEEKMNILLDKVRKIESNTSIKPIELQADIEVLRRLNTNLEKLYFELKEKNDRDVKEFTALNEKHENLVEELNEKNAIIDIYKQEENQYVNQLNHLQKVSSDQLSQLQQCEQNLRKIQNDTILVNKTDFDNIENKIKKLINGIYRAINRKIGDTDQKGVLDVKTIIADTLKSHTGNIIAAVKDLQIIVESSQSEG